MRIGVNGRFLTARVTGVQRFARELCDVLYDRADIVLLVPANAVVPESTGDRAAVIRGKLSGQAWEQLELASAARAAACDLVLHPANSAPWLNQLPSVVVVHDVLPLTNPQWFTRGYALWHRHAIRPALRRAAAVVTTSQWSAREIERACAIPPGRITVVTQGLTPFDAPADARITARVTAGYGLDAPFLLAVGYGDPRKNIDFLFPVVEALRATIAPDLLLAVVGAGARHVHGALQPALPSWVRHVPSPDDIELRALYTAARVLCFPSLAEGFGRPPLEALACGTPAVVADYGPAGEVLDDVAPIVALETDAWVRVLGELLGSEALLAAQVARARPFLARWQWSLAAEQVLAVCAVARAGTAQEVYA